VNDIESAVLNVILDLKYAVLGAIEDDEADYLFLNWSEFLLNSSLLEERRRDGKNCWERKTHFS
jgi:hypothetical protein